MPSETFEQLLERAASLCGIEPGYWDIWGRYHHHHRWRRKQAILRAMGVAAGSAAELERSLAARARREWERLAAAGGGGRRSRDGELPLSVPAESLGERAQRHGAPRGRRSRATSS